MLRFDYDGTGQSAGDMSDGERLRAWLDSVHEAVGVVRDAGAPWICLVGVRFGATLAAAAASEAGGVDALVLWDPFVSGRAFLREQSAVKLGVLPQLSEKVTGLAVPGYVFTPETVAELEDLEIASASEFRTEKVLVLLDPARRRPKRLAELLEAPAVEWQEYRGESDLFDTGRLDYVLPRPLLDQLAAWIAEACDGEPVELPWWEPGASTAVVGHCADGRPVTEELVTLGPAQLFGVSCAAPAAGTDGGSTHATVLFLSIAAESSIGPARQWVDYSRKLAAEGICSVRFDLSGIGESPARPGQPERPLYAAEALDDIADAAHAVSARDGRDVVLVGVCSGAYAALEAATRVLPRGVVAVNPIMTDAGFGNIAPAPAQAPSGKQPPPRGSRLRRQIVDRLPPFAWRVVFALGLARSPAALITPVVKKKVPTLLILGEEEARLPKKRTPGALSRLSSADHSRFVEMPPLNHSLLHEQNREEIYALLRRFLQERSDGRPSSSVNGGMERTSVTRRFASMSR